VEKTPECWQWIGGVSSKTRSIYGILWEKGQRIPAHRLSLMLHGIAIPEGHHVHHVCENTLCVRPDHLQITTNSRHRGLHSKWNQEKIIRVLKEHEARVGRPLAAPDFNVAEAKKRGMMRRVEMYLTHDLPSLNAIQRHFGSWSAAVRAAGLQEARSGMPAGGSKGSSLF